MPESPPAEKATETRKLAAIMFTDMVGFSRHMGSNEARTLRLLAVHNQIIEHAVAEHHGQIIKSTGDGFLVEFPSVVHAVQCAQRIQAQFRAHNAEQDSAEQIHIRIGIHLGDMVVQPNGDVLGDGVNIASRLQELAEPDTVCISQVVYQEVAPKLALGTVISLGRPKLKNIAQRFPVYALLSESPQGLRQTLQIQRLKLSRRVGTAHLARAALVVMGLLVGGGLVSLLYPSRPPLGTRDPALRTEAAPAALPLPDKPSIVVLPFDNMSGDPQQDYFSNGITDVLTSDLSRISSLFVIARNTAFTYKGKPTNVQAIGKDLGVRYVLEGSVQRAGEQVRIIAQLLDTITGSHLWSERYDRPLTDLFALQDEIVQQIIANLQLKVFEAELSRVKRIPTDNLTAYDAYLRGLEYSSRLTKEANTQARQMFEKATALDPQYAEAYAFLGATYWVDSVLQWSRDPQNLERALELEQQAVALDDSQPLAHRLLGWISLWKNKQYEQAIAEAERAIALDPNDAECYLTLGNMLVWAERPQEAIGLVEKAMRLNPHYGVVYLTTLGMAYRLTGQYEKAIAVLQRAITHTPQYFPAYAHLAVIYSELGREEEARAEAAEVLRRNPQFSLEGMRQANPYKDPAVVERYLDGLRKAGLK